MLARTPPFEWEREIGGAPGLFALAPILAAALVVALLFACLLAPSTAPAPTTDSLALSLGGP